MDRPLYLHLREPDEIVRHGPSVCAEDGCALCDRDRKIARIVVAAICLGGAGLLGTLVIIGSVFA